MSLMPLLFLAAQATTAPPAAPAAQSADIVVVGRRLNDALAACIARNCPPEEEVEAAMNASTESFYAGRYEESKSTLFRTVARNKRYAARMPGKLSDLYATYADVAEHEGDERAFRSATVESVDVLRKHVGRGAPAALAAAPRIGDMFANIGQTQSADDAYVAARDNAARHGQPAMAARINARRAWLAFATDRPSLARRIVAETERDYPADPGVSALLRALRVRIALKEGDDKTADALIAEMRGIPTARPALIYEPVYPVLDGTSTTPFDATGKIRDIPGRSTSGLYDWGDYRWVDIGFWVRPDGSTDDPQILRPADDASWAKPILPHVLKRRYAPLAAAPGSPGSYRIERMTLRPKWQMPTGSRIAKRMGGMTLHFVDMTDAAGDVAGAERGGGAG